MNWTKEFVVLDKAVHDRKSFDCGTAELNRFLQQFADRHREAGISRTMVLAADKALTNGKYPICAFYTITPGAIQRQTLPEALARKLPRYPVPVFLIAQLAVHRACQGKGLGKITLIKSLEHLWKINTHIKAYAVIVDCVTAEVKDFYLKYGFQLLNETDNKTRLFLPMKTVAQLFT